MYIGPPVPLKSTNLFAPSHRHTGRLLPDSWATGLRTYVTSRMPLVPHLILRLLSRDFEFVLMRVMLGQSW